MWKSLLGWVSRRKPGFWIAMGVGVFVFIVVANTPPTEDSPAPGFWDGAAAALLFGGTTMLIVVGCRRVTSFVRGRGGDVDGGEPKAIVAGEKPPDSPAESMPKPVSAARVPGVLEEDDDDDRLHPWVSEPAERLLAHGHGQDAVLAAARSINAHDQEKLRRFDKSDRNLLEEAFAETEPKAGSPRLRFPGDPQTVSWRNRMTGVRSLVAASFAGLRNVSAHDHDLDWDQETAGQYLAMLSVLARWIEECEVHRVTLVRESSDQASILPATKRPGS
ncbi:uncharacterized protein Ymh [Stackebrandtia albiflava]|uniref:Uncharacterized protein Ymh n=1 Tax=Stackebrandtia albiflava TaxID=406432 RepID=A0A562V468_9ACTN|nr:TIGR02391 family protein [Stackebrandtia albiflava]TWJ12607.1 uncharacterized protein Ymh [Stackebrandtia albiflava]